MLNQKTLIRIYQHFSELCEFKEDFVGYGLFRLVGITDKMEECAQKVRGEYFDATGVSWRESNGWCYAEYGNNWQLSESSGLIGCKFNGITYCIYLYTLHFCRFTLLNF